MIRTISIAFILSLSFQPPVLADDAHHKPTNVSQAAASLSEGEVRKVDKETKKLTIRHGPLAKLDMPAMTMVFQVKEPAMLEQVRAGDKIRFQAEKIGGTYTVTHIEPVN